MKDPRFVFALSLLIATASTTAQEAQVKRLIVTDDRNRPVRFEFTVEGKSEPTLVSDQNGVLVITPGTEIAFEKRRLTFKFSERLSELVYRRQLLTSRGAMAPQGLDGTYLLSQLLPEQDNRYFVPSLKPGFKN